MSALAGRLAAALALAALVAGCGGGSSSTTTSAASAVSTTSASTTTAAPHTRAVTTTATSSRTSATTTSSTTTSSAASTSSTTTAASSTASTTTTSTATTRTETGPAFIGGTGGSATGAVAAAVAVLARRGFATVSTATYGPSDTLHVLIGRAPGGGERAFFFDEGRFIGTDSPQTSAGITVLAHADSEVTLAYDVRPSGRRHVRFALDMGQLSALDPLPSVAERG